jgi:hypothetical protein
MITRQEDDDDKYDTGVLPGKDIESDKRSKKRGPRKRTRRANEAEQANSPRIAD